MPSAIWKNSCSSSSLHAARPLTPRHEQDPTASQRQLRIDRSKRIDSIYPLAMKHVSKETNTDKADTAIADWCRLNVQASNRLCDDKYGRLLSSTNGPNMSTSVAGGKKHVAVRVAEQTPCARHDHGSLNRHPYNGCLILCEGPDDHPYQASLTVDRMPALPQSLAASRHAVRGESRGGLQLCCVANGWT